MAFSCLLPTVDRVVDGNECKSFSWHPFEFARSWCVSAIRSNMDIFRLGLGFGEAVRATGFSCVLPGHVGQYVVVFRRLHWFAALSSSTRTFFSSFDVFHSFPRFVFGSIWHGRLDGHGVVHRHAEGHACVSSSFFLFPSQVFHVGVDSYAQERGQQDSDDDECCDERTLAHASESQDRPRPSCGGVHAIRSHDEHPHGRPLGHVVARLHGIEPRARVPCNPSTSTSYSFVVVDGGHDTSCLCSPLLVYVHVYVYVYVRVYNPWACGGRPDAVEAEGERGIDPSPSHPRPSPPLGFGVWEGSGRQPSFLHPTTTTHTNREERGEERGTTRRTDEG